MTTDLVTQIENRYKKPAVVAVASGDNVRVHQMIREGSKQRIQVFEGLVIRVDRRQSLTYRITVRKIASGVGVEKGFMVHSPNIVKIEITKRSKVRRNYISYIRGLTGKAARLKPRPFDPVAVNQIPEPETKADRKPAEEPESATVEAKKPTKSEPVDQDSQKKEPTEIEKETTKPENNLERKTPETTPASDESNSEAEESKPE